MNKFFVLILISVSMATAAFGQKSQYDDIFNYYTTEKNFNGAALVASDGKIEYLNGAGFANRQNKTKLTSKSKFRICSITKTFTAVLIMRLVEEGKIDLQAPISRYLPEYKGEGRDKITIDQLLTYSSGLDNNDQRDEAIYNTQMSPDTLIDKYFSGKLVSEPGTKFNYKNADYIILGRIIEKMSGKPYPAALKEQILDPLKMTDTDYLRNGDIIGSLANSYSFDKTTAAFSNDAPFWIENFYAAGAMYSTVEDLLKFDQAIFEYKILKKATVEQMLVSRPKLSSVGYGFWISPVKFGAITARSADRQGSIFGSNATWIHLLDQKKTVIVFSNTDATNINELREKFVLAVLNQPISLPAVGKAESSPQADSKNLSRFAGTWQIDLRPTPDAEPYLKDFVISNISEKNFSGVFYGTSFEGGKFNGNWERIYFAFETGDQDSAYYHSGYIEGDEIHGISYSPNRKFVSPWSGKKKL